VRTLAVAFRLLGLLLAPGRGRPPSIAPRPEELAGHGDGERLLFEVEELNARLGEAREAARQMEERASAADAALRAEIESSRARTAELEAQLAGGGPARARELELESLCAEQTRALEQGERRVAELEGEIATLMERVAALADGERLAANGATRWDEPALEDAGDAFVEEEPAAATIELVEGEDEQLGEIAAAAVAALEEGGVADDADGTLDVQVDVEVAVAPGLAIEQDGEASDAAAEVSIEASIEAMDEPVATPADVVELADGDPAPASVAVVEAPTQAVLLVDARPSAQEHACAAATDVGAAFWCGDGALPASSGAVVAVNLLDDALARLVDSPADVWSASRWIVYGAVAEAELGFELGSCALIRRPIEPRQALAQIRAKTGPKVNGILLVSAQLREVAGLRQALQEVDAASSVACDTRQALDLLEIIRRPDAIVIDLALPQGQGLGLAAQLRRQPETASLPMLLLLPAAVDPARLAAEAEKAQLLGPFVDEDVHRLVRATLAGRA
jgi:CheY-like chemotaxis protein